MANSLAMNRKYLCPYCRQESLREGNKYWPFCSERCKMIDLGMWAKEEYRIPTAEQLEPSDLVSAPANDDED